jgi:ATP-binding cassette subfamily C (CFTR/MRP) protein 4
LGELPSVSGQLNVNGRLAYAAQEPWIFSGSIRDNILFGKPFDCRWYEKVVVACGLKRDLVLLPYGDASLVGDRGISLSGGQKARVNLARAVYSDRDIYLLDDPLSAVDAEVGKHLFEKCIRGILRKKAVLLVTHQLQFLKAADEIVILNGGKVEIQGSYPKLRQSGLNLAQLLQTKETSPTGQVSVSRGGLRKISSSTGMSSRLASMEMNVLSRCSSPLPEFEDDLENTFSFSTSLTLSQGQDQGQ